MGNKCNEWEIEVRRRRLINWHPEGSAEGHRINKNAMCSIVSTL